MSQYSQDLNERYQLDTNAAAIFEAMKPHDYMNRPAVVLPILVRINGNVGSWQLYEDALKVSQEVGRIELAKLYA